MPISVGQFENLAGQVLSIYDEAERKMVDRVAKRLERGVTSPGWTEQKYAEMRAMQRELRNINERLIYDRKGITDDIVKTAYLNASQSFVNEARTVAGLMHVDHVSPNVVKVINILNDLNNSMDAADRTTLRRANDAYADIVGHASALVATGAYTVREAVQMELNRFADRGIGSFVDKAGRSWEMASYAEMATLTAIERATIAGYVDTMQEYGFDLAQISSHYGACPLCEAWEGVIISVTGETHGYPTLDEAEGAGCFHPRCLHTISTYYEGISKPGRKEPRPVSSENPGYSVRAKQRHFEHEMRRWKRRMAAAGSPEEERRAYARVRAYQARIRELIGDYNATTDTEDDYIYRKWYREGGRIKLSPAARKIQPVRLTNNFKSSIINSGTARKLVFSGIETESMPREQLDRIVAAFRQHGGVMQMDEATDAFLKMRGVEAITYNASTILMSTEPSRAAVFEELIHTRQWRTGELIDDPISKARAEISAKEKLLQNAKAYRLTDGDIEITRQLLEKDREDLSKLIGGGK